MEYISRLNLKVSILALAVLLIPSSALAQDAAGNVAGAITERSRVLDILDITDVLSPRKSPHCLVVSSSGGQTCQDAGGFVSTCAVAACPSGYTLTGGGGSCSAGDRKIKSLFPRFDKAEFVIACEQQGVPPSVQAICCKF